MPPPDLLPGLLLAIVCIWASGLIIGYGIGRRRGKSYQDWLARAVGRATAQNVKLREQLESRRDPADFWKGEDLEDK